jgi:hypothetical protein
VVIEPIRRALRSSGDAARALGLKANAIQRGIILRSALVPDESERNQPFTIFARA